MAFTYSPKIVTDGLVFAVDAANTKSYPGSGTTWTDLSGNGNNGTLVNGPTFDSGNGGSIVFDGANDYINIGSNTGFDFSSNQTILMVLKPEESNISRRNPYAQAYGGYGTITHEPAGQFSYYHGTNGSDGNPYQGTSSNFTVLENEVAMITLTRSPTYVRWYKNGILTQQQNNNYPTAVNNNRPIYLCAGYVSNYLGKVYLTFLYDKVLTTQEVSQNYNALKGRFGL
jgi:hypothetical protein